MQHLDRLEPNWDSYGAPKVSSQAIVQALKTLGGILDDDSPAPTVVPTSAGNVQLEWHEGGVDLEIRCSPAGPVSAYLYEHATGAEEELAHVGPDELARLAGVIRRIQA